MPSQTQKILRKAAVQIYPLITAEFSSQSAKRYNNEKWTLSELDEWKSITLPKTLKERHETKEGLHLTKEELVLLMDWKLAKGKFRPTLPKLIKSNSTESVLEFSKDGFIIFMDYLELVDAKDWSQISLDSYKTMIRRSLKALCQLKGVGPATASLILSLLKEITKFAPPFFSDESFMYFITDASHPSKPIKYTVKEYIEDFVPVLVNMSIEDKESSPSILEQGAWSLKTYQLYRIDRLADMKLPFELDDKYLQSINYPSDNLPEKPSGKRNSSEVQESKNKKRKWSVS